MWTKSYSLLRLLPAQHQTYLRSILAPSFSLHAALLYICVHMRICLYLLCLLTWNRTWYAASRLHPDVMGLPSPLCNIYIYIPYVHYSKSQIHPVRAFSLWYLYLEGLSRVVCGTLILILVYFTNGCTILIQYSGHSIPHPPVHMN